MQNHTAIKSYIVHIIYKLINKYKKIFINNKSKLFHSICVLNCLFLYFFLITFINFILQTGIIF